MSERFLGHHYHGPQTRWTLDATAEEIAALAATRTPARLRIGEAVLAPVHACGRCAVTTIDQEFGAALGGEPLATLSRTRQRDGEPVFGVRYSVQQPGRIRVGDAVEMLA